MKYIMPPYYQHIKTPCQMLKKFLITKKVELFYLNVINNMPKSNLCNTKEL